MATQSFRQSDGSFKPVPQSLAPTGGLSDPSNTDALRRGRLAASDELLKEIEALRLADRVSLPPALRDRIRALHVAVNGLGSEAKLKTCRAGHDFVLALQQPLLAANPRNPVTRPSGHRVPGQRRRGPPQE